MRRSRDRDDYKRDPELLRGVTSVDYKDAELLKKFINKLDIPEPEKNRLLTMTIYFVLYVVVTALSLPGAAVMTLAGGA